MKKIYDLKQSDILKRKLKIKISISFITFFAGLFILVLLTTLRKDATHNLILTVNIIISLILGWGLMTFYFFDIKETKNTVAFYRKLKNAGSEVISSTVKKINNVALTRSGRRFYEIYIEEGKSKRLLYWEADRCLPALPAGTKIKVEISGNIIIAYEAENA